MKRICRNSFERKRWHGTNQTLAEIKQAYKQAKKIVAGLDEAKQIREGTLQATTFEEFFQEAI